MRAKNYLFDLNVEHEGKKNIKKMFLLRTFSISEDTESQYKIKYWQASTLALYKISCFVPFTHFLDSRALQGASAKLNATVLIRNLLSKSVK